MEPKNSVFAARRVAYPPFPHYPQRKKKEAKKKERTAAIFPALCCTSDYNSRMAVWYGTNKHNFEILKNPPNFELTHCSVCGAVIRLPDGGYMQLGPSYWCGACAVKKRQEDAKPRIAE